MLFDPNNPIVKLCAYGMELEGSGKQHEASEIFLRAWNEATADLEKMIAAHYVARHQPTAEAKLKWDQVALELALKIDDHTVKSFYPSLYLNIAKCYEDLNDADNARKNYHSALSYAEMLPDDGYGNMIKAGIKKGIERTA